MWTGEAFFKVRRISRWIDVSAIDVHVSWTHVQHWIACTTALFSKPLNSCFLYWEPDLDQWRSSRSTEPRIETEDTNIRGLSVTVRNLDTHLPRSRATKYAGTIARAILTYTARDMQMSFWSCNGLVRSERTMQIIRELYNRWIISSAFSFYQRNIHKVSKLGTPRDRYRCGETHACTHIHTHIHTYTHTFTHILIRVHMHTP